MQIILYNDNDDNSYEFIMYETDMNIVITVITMIAIVTSKIVVMTMEMMVIFYHYQ